MTNLDVYSLDPGRMVSLITDEMDFRCRSIEAGMAASDRLEEYTTTVTSFVKCINSGFFGFIETLDARLREAVLGKARLVINGEQRNLLTGSPMERDWTIKRFSLLRATLEIALDYPAREGTRTDTISGEVMFLPNEGFIKWQDGTLECFRSYRRNAIDDERYGERDFIDLVAVFSIVRRGSELRHGGLVRDEPEVLVMRKICQDDQWPGWTTP